MMKKRSNKIFLVRLLLVFVTLTSGLLYKPLFAYRRQELIDSSALTIRISDASAFLQAIEKSSLGQLWNSKEMKPFLNNQSLSEALKETLFQTIYSHKRNNKEISYLFRKSLKLLKRELVLGFAPSEQKGVTNMFLVVAMDEQDYQKMNALDERLAELDENMSSPHKFKFQGVDLFRINWKDSPDMTESQWEAFYGGTMVSGNSREWVERCIVQLKKELPAIPKGPPTLQLQVTEDFIKAFFDSKNKQNKENLEPEETEEEPQGPPIPSSSVILNALGLDQLEKISLEFFLKPKALESQMVIKTRGEWNKGLLTLFTKKRVPLNHRLPYVPEDVYRYMVLQMDFNAFWKEFPNILKSINPQYEQNFKGFEEMFAGMYKVNLSQEVFGNLDTLISIFSRMEKQENQELFAIQLHNPMVMEKLLAKLYGEGSPLAAQLQQSLEIYELHGHKLYTFKGQQKRSKESSHVEESPQLETSRIVISVADDALVFGNDKMVHSLIQAASKTPNNNTQTLYKQSFFTHLIQQVPDDAFSYTFFNISRLIKPMLDLLKNPLIMEMMVENHQDKEKNKPTPMELFLKKLRYDRLPSVDFMMSFFGKGMTYSRFEKNDMVSKGIFHYKVKK